jgi:uncharacterized membrane protein
MKTSKIILQLLIGALPLIYLLAIWNDLPASVPLHYNASFVADKYGSKLEMLALITFMIIIGLGVSLLISNIHKIDPKKKIPVNNSIAKKLSWVILVFISALSVYVVFETSHYSKTNSSTFSPKILAVGISALFMILGNFLNNVKPNYFIGFRTPWTLENEDNWRKTHHLGSKIWFFGGMLMIVLTLIIPEHYSHIVMLGGLFPLTLVPIAYSYYLFLQSKKHA